MAYLKPFLLAAAAFTALDLLWLGVVARGIYARYLGQHMRPSTDWIAAILFYFIFPFHKKILLDIMGKHLRTFLQNLLHDRNLSCLLAFR